MDKTLMGLVGAVSAVAASHAQAAVAPPLTVDTVMQARSYAELLRPIPNALELLEASNARIAAGAPSVDLAPTAPEIMRVQYYHHHHHHHHRHRYVRRYHHHHHHTVARAIARAIDRAR